MSQQLESYQDEIYLTGLTGTVPDFPADLGRLEEAARAVMTPQAHDFVAGSAGTEDTAKANLAAFRRWRIVPRMLTDVSTPSYATTVLGTNLMVPFLLAPVGVLAIAHPDAELTVARAAGIRSGPGMLKALALGARAVLIGRPYVYGLALGSEAGVRHVLRALRQDFELTMRLTGLSRLSHLGPDWLQHQPAAGRP